MRSASPAIESALSLNGPLALRKLSSGTLEALKYIGIVLMTADHVNKYLFNASITPLFNLGRLAVPVFGFVFAYNLARSKKCRWKPALRASQRLLFYGLIATPAFIALGGPWVGWWPLNILFLLWVFAILIYLIERPKPSKCLIVLVFVLGGAMVEFWWFGLAYCLTAWFYCRARSLPALIGWIAATGAFAVINGNYWALAALPLIVFLSPLNIPLRRSKQTFYLYYPLHFYFILMITRSDDWLRVFN